MTAKEFVEKLKAAGFAPSQSGSPRSYYEKNGVAVCVTASRALLVGDSEWRTFEEILEDLGLKRKLKVFKLFQSGCLGCPFVVEAADTEKCCGAQEASKSTRWPLHKDWSCPVWCPLPVLVERA